MDKKRTVVRFRTGFVACFKEEYGQLFDVFVWDRDLQGRYKGPEGIEGYRIAKGGKYEICIDNEWQEFRPEEYITPDNKMGDKYWNPADMPKTGHQCVFNLNGEYFIMIQDNTICINEVNGIPLTPGPNIALGFKLENGDFYYMTEPGWRKLDAETWVQSYVRPMEAVNPS